MAGATDAIADLDGPTVQLKPRDEAIQASRQHGIEDHVAERFAHAEQGRADRVQVEAEAARVEPPAAAHGDTAGAQLAPARRRLEAIREVRVRARKVHVALARR